MGKIIVFGIGNVGKAFIRHDTYNELKEKYEEIYYYDNNETIKDKSIQIKKSSNLCDGDVLITSKYWREMYRECVLKKANVIGILPSIEEGISSYKDLCKKTYNYYENDEMIVFNKNKEMVLKRNEEEFEKTGNIFGNFEEIAIMLSNLCNYSLLHPQCPASKIEKKEILSSKIVYKLLDELSNIGFNGGVCFHIYNEPTIDPRLFKFIEYAKRVMPKCTVRLYSNGYYLNQLMIDEYIEAGVGAINTTGYGKMEFDRLTSYNASIPYSVLFGNLDERLNYYNENEKDNLFIGEKCRTFLNQICVYSNGDIGLCCLDYKHPYGFGNVENESLESILSSKKIVELQSRLLEGNRSDCSLCRNCGWSR